MASLKYMKRTIYGRPPQEHRVPTTIVDTNLCARNLANKQERSRCIGTEHIDTRYRQLSIRTIGKQEQFKKRVFLAWGGDQFGVLVLCYRGI